jgi:hypothetical protein
LGWLNSQPCGSPKDRSCGGPCLWMNCSVTSNKRALSGIYTALGPGQPSKDVVAFAMFKKSGICAVKCRVTSNKRALSGIYPALGPREGCAETQRGWWSSKGAIGSISPPYWSHDRTEVHRWSPWCHQRKPRSRTSWISHVSGRPIPHK